ncbi:hypothetical protein ACJZ2D_009322 [Fusarium nematophilum]
MDCHDICPAKRQHPAKAAQARTLESEAHGCAGRGDSYVHSRLCVYEWPRPRANTTNELSRNNKESVLSCLQPATRHERDINSQGWPAMETQQYEPVQEDPPTKRTESIYLRNFSPALWDSLSKVWLTPPALRELDRRNSKRSRPRLTAPETCLLVLLDSQDTAAQILVNFEGSESKIMQTVIPIIAGDADIPNESSLPFTNLPSMTQEMTVKPVPDYFDGAITRDIHTQWRPISSLKPRGRRGTLAWQRGRQACHHGAYGARAMHALQNYGEAKPVYDGNAYTYSATYNSASGTLQLYAHYVEAPPAAGGPPRYHMTQIDGWQMTGNMDTFRRGIIAFRNARDLAKLHRDNFIRSANARASRSAQEHLLDGASQDARPSSGSHQRRSKRKGTSPSGVQEDLASKRRKKQTTRLVVAVCAGPREIAVMPQSVNFGPTVIAVCISVTVAAAVFLGLRLYCKIVRGRGLWWDDHLLIAAWVSLAVAVALAVHVVTLGFGKDVSEVDPANVPEIALVATINGIFSVFAATWSKTSFALTLIRLQGGWINRLLWVVIVSMNIIMNLVIIFSFVKCTPAQKVWHSNMPGKCWNPLVATYYNIFAGGEIVPSSFSGAIDLVLCLLAWIIIWKLPMRAREKVGVGIALTFGVFAAATAAVKCYRMLGLSSTNRTCEYSLIHFPPANGRQLFTVVAVARVGIVIWGIVESAVTIMAASIPMMRVLVLRMHHGDPDHVLAPPLRKIRIISSRSKPSVAVSTRSAPSDAASSGAILPRREEADGDVFYVGRESSMQDDMDEEWHRQESHELGPVATRVEL